MSTVLTLSGQNSPRSIEKSWVSPEQWHGSSDDGMSKTEPLTASWDLENPWHSTSPSIEGSPSALLTLHPYLNESQPTPRGRSGTRLQEEDYYTFDPEPLTNKAPWSTPSPVSYGRRDHGAPEWPSRFPYGYAARYDLPIPLPDSLPYRRQGTYKGKGTSRLIAGGDHEMEGGRSGPLAELTDAERLTQARVLYDHERRRADHLEQVIKEMKKGKKPGHDPLRCTGPQTDRFSLPQPTNYEGPPTSGPSGTYTIDRLLPMSEVKPFLMEKPEHFKGAHDDIERFLGDCQTYFEVFCRHYMQHPVLMIVFATSLFRGAAQDWWVHLQDEYEYDPDEEEEGENEDEDDDAPFNGGPQY